MKSDIFCSVMCPLLVVLFFFGLSGNSTLAAEADDSVSVGVKTIPLAGQWSFRIDPENVGLEQRWFDREPDQSICISLPGSTTEGGFGDDVSVDTQWTGGIVDRSWFTDDKYEKYRKPGLIKVPFWLTPVKHYIGPAWYQKNITIPDTWKDKHIELFLERCHWVTTVWVDGKPAGSRDSLCTAHQYDLTELATPGQHVLTICVDNSIKYNVGVNAHSISDHTQSNWNGIVGRMELRAENKVRIEDVQLYPDIEDKKVNLKITIRNDFDKKIDGAIVINAVSKSSGRLSIARLMLAMVEAGQGLNVIDQEYVLGEKVLLWDEFSPSVYDLSIALYLKTSDSAMTKALYWQEVSDRQNDKFGRFFSNIKNHKFASNYECSFGMRQFSADGRQFTINDRPVFLRGTLECCIFPLTGYPAMSVEQWSRILKTAKSYGLNHLRFHSWCPPEAAFEAADRMGVYFHIETPCWTTVGDGKPIDKYIYAEGDRILKAYGNHPSFCMLAYGNEPGGGKQKRFLCDLVNYWKDKDSRRVYTSAAGWPSIDENQYHSTPSPRGHQWGGWTKKQIQRQSPRDSHRLSGFYQPIRCACREP